MGVISLGNSLIWSHFVCWLPFGQPEASGGKRGLGGAPPKNIKTGLKDVCLGSVGILGVTELLCFLPSLNVVALHTTKLQV